METKDLVQLACLIFGLSAGIFIQPKVATKIAGVLIAVAVVGLILSAIVHSESLIWIFGLSAIAVGWITMITIISGVATSFLKQTLCKNKSK